MRKGWVLLIWAGVGVMLLPFWVMVVLSLQPAAQVTAGQASWLWPAQATLANYTKLFATVPMARYAANSALVAGVTTVVHVVLAAMAGYGLARLHVPGNALWNLLCLGTLMIPPQVNLVPLFLLMSALGWVDTYLALIVPGLFGAFGVFLYRQWFLQLPTALEEAAVLDGCSPWQRFWQVAWPLAAPMTATLALFVFVASWNSFLWPLVVTFSDELRTLPVGLAALKSSFRETTDWALLMAGATVATVPVIAVFLVGQRTFMAGLMASIGKD